MMTAQSCEEKYPPTLRVLSFLLEQKIALIPQIHTFCFPGKTERYARHVISKMIEQQLIQFQAIQRSSLKPLTALQATKKGLEEFQLITGIKIGKVQLNAHSRMHDAELTNLRILFSGVEQCQSYVTENVIQSKMFEDIYPDLLIFRTHHSDAGVCLDIRNSKIWLPVEFERTDKTIERTSEKLSRWYQNEDLRGIIVVTEDSILKQKLVRIDRDIYPNIGRKIIFSTIDNIKSAKTEVILENSKQEKLILRKSSRLKNHFPFLDQDLSIRI